MSERAGCDGLYVVLSLLLVVRCLCQPEGLAGTRAMVSLEALRSWRSLSVWGRAATHRPLETVAYGVIRGRLLFSTSCAHCHVFGEL